MGSQEYSTHGVDNTPYVPTEADWAELVAYWAATENVRASGEPDQICPDFADYPMYPAPANIDPTEYDLDSPFTDSPIPQWMTDLEAGNDLDPAADLQDELGIPNREVPRLW